MPRYHAREVAIEYARMSDAIVVLGSATPSVDSFYKAKTGVYRLLELDKRVDDRPLPKCEVVDLRQELREGNRSILSTRLQELIKPAYYIDLAGTYPSYTCPVAMGDIKAAYSSGYNLVCRCALGAYTATLPLFIPMPAANTWIFSGSGALESMNFSAQSFTVAITANGVAAQNKQLMPFHTVLSLDQSDILNLTRRFLPRRE